MPSAGIRGAALENVLEFGTQLVFFQVRKFPQQRFLFLIQIGGSADGNLDNLISPLLAAQGRNALPLKGEHVSGLCSLRNFELFVSIQRGNADAVSESRLNKGVLLS